MTAACAGAVAASLLKGEVLVVESKASGLRP